MMLYRPFLHYVSQKTCTKKSLDERSYACAAACVSVARNVVHITAEMQRRGLLIGAYWFTMYTTFFAVLSLVFFVLENPDKPGSQEILADATGGKDALKGLARRSMAADRCAIALEVRFGKLCFWVQYTRLQTYEQGLFGQLAPRLKDGTPTPVTTQKKRSAPSSNHLGSQDVYSSPDVSQLESGPIAAPPRATTFPVPLSVGPATAPRNLSPLDHGRFQINTLSDPNLRHSFHELMSPTDLSTISTPDSGSTTNSLHQPQQNLQQFGSTDGLPDLSAMMFPSEDPFAYPNQPMMEFENQKQESFANILNDSRVPPMFLSNGATPVFDDLEGQLFGPLPPYFMQGQQNFDIATSLEGGHGMMGLSNQDANIHTGMTPNADMHFDGIFSGDGDEWSSMLTDQRFR